MANNKLGRKLEGSQAQIELGQLLVENLSQLPDIEILNVTSENATPSGSVDMVISLRCKNETSRLLVEIKGKRLYPKDALQVAEKLREQKGVPMLAASSLSESSRSLLRENRTAYWDKSGSLYLDLPSALYLIDKPGKTPPRQNRELKNPFKGSSAQVLHALLLEPQRSWKVTELADTAKVSPYTSHQVLDYLEKQLWVTKKGRGPQGVRLLSQPGKLLDAWAANHSLEVYQPLRFHQLAKSPQAQKEQMGEFLGLQKAPWAVTLEHGAQALAPFVTQLPSVVTVIVPESIPWLAAAKDSGYREVHEGENLLLWMVKDQAPFLGCRPINNLEIASPVQLYLDLFQWPRRGKEQAQNLRQKVLKF